MSKIPKNLTDKDMLKNWVEQETVEDKFLRAEKIEDKRRRERAGAVRIPEDAVREQHGADAAGLDHLDDAHEVRMQERFAAEDADEFDAAFGEDDVQFAGDLVERFRARMLAVVARLADAVAAADHVDQRVGDVPSRPGKAQGLHAANPPKSQVTRRVR